MADPIASSGTLIAAALETVGYHYQSYILDALIGPDGGGVGVGGNPLASIATVIYIVAGATAFGTFVLTGRHKFALWFFLGPGLFYFVTVYRIEDAGPAWMFGNEARNEDLKALTVRETLGYSDATGNLPIPRVSWFFAGFNDLLSYSSRSLVDLILYERKQLDLRFMVRAPLYGVMVTSMIDDKNFKELLHVALLRECKDLYQAAMNVSDKTLPIKVQEAAQATLRQPHYAKLTNGAAEYIAALTVDYPRVAKMIEIANVSARDPKVNTANDFFQVPLDQLMKEFEKDDKTRRSKGWTDPSHPGRQKEIAEERNSLLNCKDWRCRCDFIWTYSYVGLHRAAMMTYDSGSGQMVSLGIDQDQLNKDWLQAAGYGPQRGPHTQETEDDKLKRKGEERLAIYRVIARHLFRNEVLRGQPGAVIAELAKRGQEYGSLSIKGENELSTVERLRVINNQWKDKSRMVNAAAAIPYYQGLLLYILGLSYPFFCFLLLLPGRHSSYLLFFGLWFWVKTWDIAYAFVMMLDEVFYTIFAGSRAAQHAAQGTTPELSDDVGLAFQALQAVDPSFDLATYYSVIAVCINAIPVVTSYLTIGTLRGGAGLIAEGIKTFSESFAKASWKTSSNYGVFGYRLSTLERKAQEAEGYMNSDDGSRVGLHSSPQAVQQFAQATGIDSPSRERGATLPGLGDGHSLSDLSDWRVASAGVKGAANAIANDLRLSTANAFGLGARDPGDNPSANRSNLMRSAAQAYGIQSVSKAIGTLAGGMSEVSSGAHWDHLQRHGGWASWDSMTSPQSKMDMVFARYYDVFELPFMDLETDGNRMEFDIMLNDNARFAAMSGAAIDAFFGLIDDVAKWKINRAYQTDREPELSYKRQIDASYQQRRRDIRYQQDYEIGRMLMEQRDSAARDRDFPGLNPGGGSSGPISGIIGGTSGFIPGFPGLMGGGESEEDVRLASGEGKAKGGIPRAGSGEPNADGGEPQYAFGDPRYGRGGDPNLLSEHDRPYGQDVRKRDDEEGRVAYLEDSGEGRGGRKADNRADYGDPARDATEAMVRAAHQRLEYALAEATARGIDSAEINAAENLSQGFNSSESSYDAAAAAVKKAINKHSGKNEEKLT